MSDTSSAEPEGTSWQYFFSESYGTKRLHTSHRYLPYVGMVTIIMNDYPYLKFLLIGMLGLFVLSNRE